MDSTYDYLSSFALSSGLLYCFVMFLGVLVYALWPANGDRFNEAASAPLRED